MYKINREKCVDCGYCSFVCPFDSIHHHLEDQYYEIDDTLCKECGQCYTACVASAIDCDDNTLKGALVFSVFVGILLAVAMFVILPTYIPEWINGIFSTTLSPFAKIAVQEVAKILIIIGYFISISKMQDIRRVFMYHGAEHKTISCYENELELTVDNVMKSDKHHDRCGTSFIVYVFVLSILLVMIASFVFQAVGFMAYFEKGWV
ncbi:MAG: DUF1385 domain-containing protein, partial [Clostridia bacterium]|nr:DUF1385 domain-containing protein [Clostridia bacterium]